GRSGRTVSKHLGAGQALEMVVTLKTAIRDYTARAVKLNEEGRVKLNRERQRRQAALEEQSRELAANLAEADASFEKAKRTLLANFEKRKTRIGKAFQSSKEQGLKRIDDEVGARKYELQKKMLQAERDREAGVSAATATLQEIKTRLAAELASLNKLEGVAQKSFRGYPKFLQ